MTARPWYIQAADLSHRLFVLGLLGFSGYLGYGVVRSIQFNAQKKALRQAQERAAAGTGEGVQADAQPQQLPDASQLSSK